MTARADRIRNRRRAFAAPGSSLDRTVRWLAIGLPALVGVVVAPHALKAQQLLPDGRDRPLELLHALVGAAGLMEAEPGQAAEVESLARHLR